MTDQTLENLSLSIIESLVSGIDSFGFASIVVCGGKSPLPIYHNLRNADLDWKKISVYLGDDRVVSKDHEHSNHNLIKKHLLTNNARFAKFFSLVHVSPEVADLSLPFDIVLLGLGSDGHFASLFPDQLYQKTTFGIDANPAFIRSDKPLGFPSYKRVSMNLSLLLNTKRCILLVPNKDKRIVVEKAYRSNKMPLHFLLTQEKTKIEFSDIDF